MGVFDFLYKTPNSHQQPRSKNYRRYGGPGSTPVHHSHYKQRTKTYVEKKTSLPDDFPGAKHQEREAIDSSRNRNYRSSYNQKKGNYKTKNLHDDLDVDVIDYYNKSKYDQNDDDFTRLSRLEVKIDNYITRHNEISDELDNIRSNLHLTYKEFKEEFEDEIIGGNKNKHIVEIGERILDKLDAFKIDKSNDSKMNGQDNSSTGGNTTEQTKTSKWIENAHISKKPVSSTAEKQEEPYADQKSNDDPLFRNNNGLPPVSLVKVTMNGSMTPKTSTYTIARAKYAIVNSSIPEDSPSITHYKSTPSLLQPPQTSSTPSFPPTVSSLDDSFANMRYSPVAVSHQRAVQLTPRLYLNMTMSMHSDHPQIESCFRRIELLRPRIMHYKSEHKLRVYRELDSEIASLMKKLKMIDCSKDALFSNDKNIALSELHNLLGVLERSIECQDPECVICNSFIYKPEISV